MKFNIVLKYIFLFFVLYIKKALAILYGSSEESLNEIPLDKVVVHSKIKNTIAEVYVQQTYINNSENTIEAIYKFPLDSEASVVSFEADIDGQSLYAKIYKNDEATKLYEQELDKGNMAFLLEEEYKDVFQVSIGNLKPKQTVHIKLTYVTELNSGNENNKVTFVLPTVIAPRYGKNSSSSDSKIIKGNPKYSDNVDYTLDLNIELEMNGKIKSIESPSHEINKTISEKNNNEAVVTLKSKKVYLDKDFILTIEADNLDTSSVLIEYNEELKSYASLITLIPNLVQNEKLKVEIIFLIDQSGSMHGWKNEYLKDALTLFLKSMPVDSYFNIVSFGSLHENLFEKSVKYDEESLNKAIEYVKKMDASMGGTEIRNPLEYIYETKIPEGFNRSIFLLTDGEIWDVDPVIDLVRENSSKQNSVLYTFGIGKSVSHYLVSSIARNGNGMSLFVTEGERLEKKVLLQLKNVLIPFVQEYTISWKEKGTDKVIKMDDIEQTPYKPPLIRMGTRYFIYVISDKPLIPSPIEISYKLSDGTTKTETLTFENIKELKDGKMIHSLAANNLIRDLQEGTSKIHYSDEYKNRLEDDDLTKKLQDTIKEKIIDISTKYQIMSKFTSFLCIKELEDKDKPEGKSKKVIVPSKGISMSQEPLFRKPLTFMKKRTFSGASLSRDLPKASFNSFIGNTHGLNNNNNFNKNEDDHREETDTIDEIHFREHENTFDISDINLIKMKNANPTEKEKSQRLLFNNLIQHQNFDGSFKLSDLLDTIIKPIYGEEFSSEWKKELDGIKTNYKEAYPDIVDQFDKLIGTSISCVILTDYLSELQSEWELVKEKSEKWISQKQKQNPIQDIRQKILISINQKREHLLNILNRLQNEDGSLTFTSIKEHIVDKYYGKVVSNEWSQELKEIESKALPSQMEQFNKFLGSTLTLNILNNEKFDGEFKESSDKMVQRLKEWLSINEKQNPLLKRFHEDLESSLQYNKKKKSIISKYMSFKGETDSFACYQDILKDRLLSDQESDGSFTIYSILGKLREMENNSGACQKEHQRYTKWINEWFNEVNKVIGKSEKDLSDDDEKRFINSLWGTLVAIHIHDEISNEIIQSNKENISDLESFKKEFLYQDSFDKAQEWVKKCFSDPEKIPLISKWWKEPKEEHHSENSEDKKNDDSKDNKENKASTNHDEL